MGANIPCALSLHTTSGMATAFQYLDDPSFRLLYCSKDEPRKIQFYVEGIRCSKCVSKIENLKNINSDLSSIEVDIAHQTARVELRDVKGSFSRVAEGLAALGFRAVPVPPEEDTSRIWNQEARRDLIRIAVAAFSAGNIMTLAFATYFGLEGWMKSVFEWTQFVLYLPVVSYVAWPFYQGFWRGVRTKSLSIDGPMAIASFLGFAVSSWNLFRGTGSLYFDSTSGFLFLILSTRFFQKRLRYEFLKFLKPESLSATFKARLKVGNSWSWIRSDQLKKGQVVLVEKDEWIPADGELLSDSAVLDLSVLDGESRPVKIQKGFSIRAGAKALSSHLEVQVQSSGKSTLLGQLLSRLKGESVESTEASHLSNQASQWLLIVVFSLAFLTLVIGSAIDFHAAFERAFALIVLACPCAMAFGTPLAFSFSMKRAQEKSILIKKVQIFEELKNIKTVILDKTGTLTGRSWEVVESSSPKDQALYQNLILALESKSQHPVAFALRHLWGAAEGQEALSLEHLEEHSTGVRGQWQGIQWDFHSFFENQTKVYGLFRQGILVWKFQLRTPLREGALDLVKELQKRKFNVVLLSGDGKEETERIARELNLENQNVYWGQTAEQKADFVSQAPQALMIGDGVNDSLALEKASIGIAVHGGVDLALKSADVLLLKSDLSLVMDLFRIGHQARRQIRRNLSVALIYNSIGGLAALLGWINPFVAALLMPISSLFILMITWWGTRR